MYNVLVFMTHVRVTRVTRVTLVSNIPSFVCCAAKGAEPFCYKEYLSTPKLRRNYVGSAPSARRRRTRKTIQCADGAPSFSYRRSLYCRHDC